MSGDARDGAPPTALDLLFGQLGKDEQIAVLRFAQDRHYDADNEVFFLIALLKLFNGTAEEALAIYKQIHAARQNMQEMIIAMEERTAGLVEAEVDGFHAKFDES